jgi:uncharacterized BrkB/YihY/UPF0761 family membrane protein
MELALLFSLVACGALLASGLVMLLLRRHLRSVLVDVCGSDRRAEFWVAVSGVWIVLLGVLAGTATVGYWNQAGGLDLFGGATSQVRILLIGLLGAVITVAVALLYAIHQRNRPVGAPWTTAPPPAMPPAGDPTPGR